MNKNIAAWAIGIATSVIGGYIYSYLLSINFPFVYAIGIGVVCAICVGTVYFYRGKFFLLALSGIRGYYPNGQAAYAHRAAQEVERSKKVVIVGARGSDLTGESSPIAKALSASKNVEEVSIFLLDPKGDHLRLRSDHLEVERRKYIAESEGVDAFIGVLKLHERKPVKKFTYNRKPLFRMIMTDASLFVSIYQPGIRGKDLPCWHISRKSKAVEQLVSLYLDSLRTESIEREYSTDALPKGEQKPSAIETKAL